MIHVICALPHFSHAPSEPLRLTAWPHGYLASPPTLQNVPANPALGLAPLSALTALPSPATEVIQHPASPVCPSYNGDPPLRHTVSDPILCLLSLLPTSHHLN